MVTFNFLPVAGYIACLPTVVFSWSPKLQHRCCVAQRFLTSLPDCRLLFVGMPESATHCHSHLLLVGISRSQSADKRFPTHPVRRTIGYRAFPPKVSRGGASLCYD